MAFANIGEVAELDGVPAQIERSGSEFIAKLQTDIENMDQVETTNGRLKISFVDDTEVSLTEHTYLEINEYVFDPDPNKSRMALNFAQGTARFATGKLGLVPRENISIQTPTATIGIRGTDFTTTVDELGRSLIILLPDSNCLESRKLEAGCVPSGIISVKNLGGTVILDEAYQAVLVSTSETPPTNPVVLENITLNMIDNMFIVSEPPEIEVESNESKKQKDLLDYDGLDKDFLEEDLLEISETERLDFDILDIDYLDIDILTDLLDTLDVTVGNLLDEELLNDKQAKTNITGTINPGYDPETGYNTIVEANYVWFYRENSGIISLKLDTGGLYKIITQPSEGDPSTICVNTCGGSEIFIKQGG